MKPSHYGPTSAQYEITQQLNLFCRAIDRRDNDLLKQTFWADATVDYGIFNGNGHQFADWLMTLFSESGMGVTSHSISNVIIGLERPYAFVESQFIARHKVRSEGGSERLIVTGGRYHDRFECRDGQWKIVHRRPILDWFTDDPSRSFAEKPMGLDPLTIQLGQAGPDDDDDFAPLLDASLN